MTPASTIGPRVKGRFMNCVHCNGPFWATPSRERQGIKYCSATCMKIVQAGSADPIEAFWLKVDKGPHPKGCWLYTGFRKWDGYGWLCRNRRYMTAHRYAWILAHGQPPQGLHIMHKCDVPACCNPDHLQLGTHQDNMADMIAKGRSNNGKRGSVFHPERVRPRRAA